MGEVLPRNDVLDSPSFSITWVFFGAVLEALKDMKDHIQLEVLRGELNQELLKMRTSGDQHRPAHFPRTFTRMWLSNVPYVFSFLHRPCYCSSNPLYPVITLTAHSIRLCMLFQVFSLTPTAQWALTACSTLRSGAMTMSSPTRKTFIQTIYFAWFSPDLCTVILY